MTEPSHAIFLSYASQDQEAALRICAALRAAGVEVWFDQSELRGGDAWDQSIRKQIKTCALFLPIISKHTHDRAEGYFRLEWKLAVDRSHLIMANKAFLVPVVIDDTDDDDENVPEKFRDVQWMRLPAGQTSPEFVTRIHQLLSSDSGHPPTLARTSATAPSGRLPRLKLAWLAAAFVLAALVAYQLAEKPWTVKPVSPSKPATSADIPMAFNPPLHSIAVLPFVNMSGDKEQQYFSEGLTEELLNSLSRIDELQVAARTSSFSFQGEHPDIATVAHKLNVASVLEGSVRRSGHTIRITAQLNNALTGFHIWSQTYDRDLGDVLKLQTEIATAVAGALKVTLLGDVVAKIELGGTRTPAAFDAYLRGRKAYERSNAKAVVMDALAAYTEAIRLDSNYALAFAGRSIAYSRYAWADIPGVVTREVLDKALADAHQALALAPELAEGHLALAIFFAESLDFAKANEAFERARTLAPGNAWVLRASGGFAAYMGHFEAGVTALSRAVMLDPLNPRTHAALGDTLYLSRRYQEAVAAATQTVSLDRDYNGYELLGLAYYGLGDVERARASCEAKPENMQCLAVTYDKLARHADAEAVVTRMKATAGDAAAYQYATIYAQWGNTVKALESLNTAIRLRHPDLEFLKTDPLMDPLRKEPRFQAIERELKFPK